MSAYTSPISTAPQYFQYRVILESDAVGKECDYGLGSAQCSPEIKSIKVDPERYDSTGPSIVGKTGKPYLSLLTFSETLGLCAGGVTYAIGVGSDSGSATWYWWDSSLNFGQGDWTTAGLTFATSNPASEIQSHAASFAPRRGTGTVFLKAFLKSDGSTPCSLDDIELGGTQ